MPAIAAKVDQQSMCDIISPYCTPAGMWPGQVMIAGTRQAFKRRVFCPFERAVSQVRRTVRKASTHCTAPYYIRW